MRWEDAGLVTATVEERRRLTSRRDFVARGAAVAGSGLLVLAGARAILAAQDFENDVDVLNYALGLEHLAASIYREGLKRFDEAAFKAANRPETVRPSLEAIRDQEQTHVEALADAVTGVGGAPVEATTYEFDFEDIDGFLRVAATLEATMVAAYAGAVPSLSDTSLLTTLLGIHSVEARHAAYLNARTEVSPFPDAIDAPLTRAETMAAVGGFATAAAGARRDRAEGTPRAEPSPTQAPETAVTPAEQPPLHGMPIEGSSGASPADDEPSGERQTEEEPRDRTAKDERFAAVIADAATQLGVTPDQIEVVETERTEWPDASLGCPQPDQVYAQVVTPGFRVVVAAAGTQLEYHTDKQGNFVLCG